MEGNSRWGRGNSMRRGSPAVPDGERELVRRAAAREEQAFVRLTEPLYEPMLSVALGILHQREDAEDAVEEALVKAWLALPGFDGRCRFATWMHEIVVHASLDLLRAGKTRRVCEQDFAPEVLDAIVDCVAEDPVALAERRRRQQAVRAAVAELPEQQRKAVELHFEGFSHAEIAQTLGCRPGTAKSWLSRAYRKLEPSVESRLG